MYRSDYNQNDGKPGVVYILENEGLRSGYYKVGQSTRSGAHRANDLNKEATTGMPKLYRCIFECRSEDCGRAEKEVFRRLNQRLTPRQEFFHIEDLDAAKAMIGEVCASFKKVEPAKALANLAAAVAAPSRPEALPTPLQAVEAPKQCDPPSLMDKLLHPLLFVLFVLIFMYLMSGGIPKNLPFLGVIGIWVGNAFVAAVFSAMTIPFIAAVSVMFERKR